MLRREREPRHPPGNPRARRALEIGCGPGRLMWFMAAHFGEIHGVDVSDEMIQLAHQKLKDIPHAHAHATSGADLKAFADESFDYVYSYAVFQHIPGREVVFQYLREARRVMKTGAVMRCQFNGLPEAAVQYDTWSGVRISSVDLMSFLREHDFQLLALEGASTQYMWLTARKQAEGWQNLSLPVPEGVTVRRITNAHSSEPVAPSRGRFASVSLWIEGLPEYADLLRLEVHVGGWRSTVYYIGAPERDGLRQVNAMLPWEIDTGLQNVEVKWCGEQLCRPRNLRIIWTASFSSPMAMPPPIVLVGNVNFAMVDMSTM